MKSSGSYFLSPARFICGKLVKFREGNCRITTRHQNCKAALPPDPWICVLNPFRDHWSFAVDPAGRGVYSKGHRVLEASVFSLCHVNLYVLLLLLLLLLPFSERERTEDEEFGQLFRSTLTSAYCHIQQLATGRHSNDAHVGYFQRGAAVVAR